MIVPKFVFSNTTVAKDNGILDELSITLPLIVCVGFCESSLEEIINKSIKTEQKRFI